MVCETNETQDMRNKMKRLKSTDKETMWPTYPSLEIQVATPSKST